MLGFWANEGIVDEVVTVYEGLKNKYPESDIVSVSYTHLTLPTIPDV